MSADSRAGRAEVLMEPVYEAVKDLDGGEALGDRWPGADGAFPDEGDEDRVVFARTDNNRITREVEASYDSVTDTLEVCYRVSKDYPSPDGRDLRLEKAEKVAEVRDPQDAYRSVIDAYEKSQEIDEDELLEKGEQVGLQQ